MKRKIYLMLLAGGLSCSLLLSACGSDSAGTSAAAESSVAAAEADEEDDENTGEETTGESDDGDTDSGDSDSEDSDSKDSDSEDDSDSDSDEDTDEDDDDSSSGSSGTKKKTTISDKKLKKQVTALIEDVSENKASQTLASAGYEPTVTAYEGELMVYLRMPDPVDMPLYAEAICDYILEADDKYSNFSVDHIYLRTYEEADEGYVEEGTLISWATTNGEDGMFIDETNSISISDFTVDHLKAYFGTE